MVGGIRKPPASITSTPLRHVAGNVYRFVLFFFFSSRRRHTRLQGDWSSDVCSSDLPDVKIIVDANQQWTVKQAIKVGSALAEYDPYWIEDPVAAHDIDGLKAVKEAQIGRASCRERV